MDTRDVRAWGRTALAGMVALAAAGLGSCGGSSGGTEPDAEPGEIEVVVSVGSAFLADVTIRLFQAGSSSPLATRQTTTAGIALFEGLAAGAYDVEVEVPTGHELAQGQPARRSVTVRPGSRAQVAVGLRETETGIVEIRLTSGLRFDPANVTIARGTTVRWVNATNMFHTVTPSGHSEWSRQELSTNGQTFTHVFSAAGDFAYLCEPHASSGMTGSITVE